MSVITFPGDLYFEGLRWAMNYRDVDFDSPFGSQSQEIDSPRWMVTGHFGRMRESQSGSLKALLLQLKGKKNQLALWDHSRPAPLGTMRGTMTLNAPAVQGATTMQIVAAGQSAKTMLKGDLLGVGSGVTQQILPLTEDSLSNGSGVIMVTFAGTPLRNAFSSGAAVTWDKPKALFRRQDSDVGWDYESSFASGFQLSLIEDWR